MENSEKTDESECPSLDLAYAFIQPSYDVMSTRFDSANARIQNILTWAIGITAAMPLFAQIVKSTVNIQSIWFFLALGSFAATVILGIIAQRTGGVKLIDPKALDEHYVSLSKQEFRKNMLYWSGQHFDTNAKTIQTKSLFIDIMTILLGLEIVFAVIWVLIA